jgi:hypothetical protein
MNNLAYGNQDIQKIASQVEELLRKEMSATGPLAYGVEDEKAGETSAGSVLRDAGAAIFGGKGVGLCTIHFHLKQPRVVGLDVHMNRQGMGCFGGPLVYATVVSKRVGGEVSLGDDGKFAGDAEGAGKLNAKKDLLKKCGAFAMTEGGLEGLKLKIPRYLKITPHEGGAQIVAVTLPRSKSMGFSASFGSKEFLEIATQIEATL